jgi:pimeloyl-ACP methyl ester carboxylesterase
MTFRARRLNTLAVALLGSSVLATQGGAQGARERVRDRISARGRTPSSGQTRELAGRTTMIWMPKVSGTAPLLLFSHGIGGCETQSSTLMTRLRDAGYLVIAIRHADARCGSRASGGDEEPSFRDASAWTDATYRDRHDDLVAVLSALRDDRTLRLRADFDRVGLVGHSLGGYTVLGSVGAWPSWMTSSIKAVVAWSPFCQPFVDRGALPSVSAPVLYQGGTRDLGITPTVRRPGGCYDRTRAPAQYVEFAEAGHFAWTDGRTSAHEAIAATTLAFLNEQLRGQPPTPLPASVTAMITAQRRK